MVGSKTLRLRKSNPAHTSLLALCLIPWRCFLEENTNISNFDNQFLDPLWVRYCQSRKVVGLSLNTWSSYVLLFVLFSVDVMRQIDIPSVFVSEETAISLKEEYYYEAG